MCPFIDLLILTNMKELLVMYLSNSLANIQFFPAEKWDDLCSLHSWSFKVRPADCWLQRFPHPAEAAVRSKWIDRHVQHISSFICSFSAVLVLLLMIQFLKLFPSFFHTVLMLQQRRFTQGSSTHLSVCIQLC